MNWSFYWWLMFFGNVKSCKHVFYYKFHRYNVSNIYQNRKIYMFLSFDFNNLSNSWLDHCPAPKKFILKKWVCMSFLVETSKLKFLPKTPISSPILSTAACTRWCRRQTTPPGRATSLARTAPPWAWCRPTCPTGRLGCPRRPPWCPRSRVSADPSRWCPWRPATVRPRRRAPTTLALAALVAPGRWPVARRRSCTFGCRPALLGLWLEPKVSDLLIYGFIACYVSI